MNGLQKLLEFTKRLDSCKIHYLLDRPRDEAVMVRVDVPGERWEVEFFNDGRVEVEVFRSNGTVEGEESLGRLLENHSD
jgi:hypothetical protein